MPNQFPIFTKKFFLAFLSLLTQAIVMYILMTTISEYATTLGATAVLAGFVSGIYIFGALCSRFYSGHALETVGWKKMAVWSSALHCVACGGYFFADSVPLLLLVRFIHGLGFGAASNSVATIARAILPKDRFAEGCGYLMLSTTLAVGLGPFIGGSVYNLFGPRGCFGAAMLMGFFSFLFICFVDVQALDPATKHETKQDLSEQAKAVGVKRYLEPKALPISIVAALSVLGYVGIVAFGRLFAMRENLMSSFSYFFLIYAAVLVFSRPLAGKIQDRFGSRVVCYPALLAQTIGLILISFWPSGVSVILCAIGCALGYGTLISAGSAVACRSTSMERMSYAISTYYMCCDLAIGFGPALLGGLVSAHSGYTMMYFVSALITFSALPVCVYALRQK